MNPNSESLLSIATNRPIDPRRAESMMYALHALAGGHAVIAELAHECPIAYRTARRALDDYLPALGMVERAQLPLVWGRVNVARLTQSGKDFCLNEFGFLINSEWQRVIDHHDGERQPEHTAMLLVSAWRARQYAYQVTLCPTNELPYRPDMLLSEQYMFQHYVEVERHPARAKRSKWQTMVQRQGYVAAITPTAKSRRGLAMRLDRLGYPYRLTDVETLRTRQQAFWVQENEQ